MATTYDVAVVGLGAMGSAAVYHLARRGHRVLGLDRYIPPHAMGSTHGDTRIIREAYFEHPLYVPLVRRAFTLWRQLEDEAGNVRLMERNGGLMIGPREGVLVRGVLASAREHDVPHEVLTAEDLRARFPRYAPTPDCIAVFETGAGFLRPEAVIQTHLSLAERHGATMLAETAVGGWDISGEGIRVQTAREVFRARRIVLAPGAWLADLMPDLRPVLRVERQVSHWFTPIWGGDGLVSATMPISMWELEDGRLFYTTPDIGHGVKASFHHGGEITSPESVRRDVATGEVEEARRVLQRLVPGAAGSVRRSAVCLYTDTPDEHFIIDRYPEREDVVVSACSGHGFKFSSAIGEVVADLVEGAEPRVDLTPFALSRFREVM